MALTCSNYKYHSKAIGWTGGSICANPGSINVAVSVYWEGSGYADNFPFTVQLQRANTNGAWVTFTSKKGTALGGKSAHLNFTNIGYHGQALRALLIDGGGLQAGSHLFLR